MARKKPIPPGPGKLFWKGNRIARSFEVYGYPSTLARGSLFYINAVGHATHPKYEQGKATREGYLIHFMKRGQLWHRIGGKSYEAQPGEAVLMDFIEQPEYGNERPGDAEFYWVWFGSRQMPALFQEFRVDQEPLFKPTDPDRLERLFRELMVVTTKRPPVFEMRISALLTTILAELFASRRPPASFMLHAVEGKLLSGPVRRGIDFIARSYPLWLPAKHIAGAVGQSHAQFTRQFRREVGMTPIAFVIEYRVSESKRLLETTGKSVAQIARSVGFPDQNYFARAFTRSTGMSPLQYRRQSQQDAEKQRK